MTVPALWVNLVFFTWVGIVFVLFARLPKHRVIILAFVVGWQFLPEIHTPANNPEMPEALALPGLKFTKSAIAALAPLLAVLLFDFPRVRAFRPRWYDLPMIVWCLCPFLSALANPSPPDGSSPIKDGFSQTRTFLLAWGGPYFLGRLYLGEPARFREMVLGMILGGLAYVPLCLLEVRLSPQLHKFVYGFYQHDFGQSIRGGGFRPTVFMEHGLTVALWMVAVTILAFWLWWTGALVQFERGPGKRPIPVLGVLLLLLGTTVLLKSAGAISLGVLAALALLLTRTLAGPLAVAALLALAPLYVGGRISSSQPPVGWLQLKDWYDDEQVEDLKRMTFEKRLVGWAPWTSKELLDQLASLFSESRAQSFGFRLENEDKLMEKAMQRPWLGWSGWGRARVYNEEGEDMSVTDGLWILTLGDRGLVGLIALYTAMLLPALRFWWRHPVRAWTQPGLAPCVVCAVILPLYMIDNVSNAMYNPLYVLMAGALAGAAGAGVTPSDSGASEPARQAVGQQRRAAPPRKLEGRPPGVLTRPRPQA